MSDLPIDENPPMLLMRLCADGSIEILGHDVSHDVARKIRDGLTTALDMVAAQGPADPK